MKKSIRDALHENAEETEEAAPAPAPEKKPAEKKPAARRKTEKKEPVKKAEEVRTVPETAAKPQESGKGQEKTRLNAAVQRILSDAKYDTAIISFVASLAVKLHESENAKRATYTGIIKQYGQKEGLTIYNLIKKEL